MLNSYRGGDRQGASGRRALIAAVAALGGLALLQRESGAQNNPALVFRQLQAQLASLTQTNRVQAQQIQQLNAERRTTMQRLQRLQSALNAAAAAGDPTAQALRANTPDAVLDKLTAQLNTIAQQRRAGAAPEKTQIPAPDLSGAKLTGAKLPGAKLEKASMTGADLTGASLTRAVLRGSDLRGARLQSADLTGADLTGANLANALYDPQTRWPEGYDPLKHGALLVK